MKYNTVTDEQRGASIPPTPADDTGNGVQKNIEYKQDLYEEGEEFSCHNLRGRERESERKRRENRSENQREKKPVKTTILRRV